MPVLRTVSSMLCTPIILEDINKLESFIELSTCDSAAKFIIASASLNVLSTNSLSAIDLIIQKGVYGETYLIGENEEKRNIDVIRMILKTMKKPDSLMKFVEDRPGHDIRYSIVVAAV